MIKDMYGYKGLYTISDDGVIWSSKSDRELKPRIIRGYIKIDLYKNGKRKKHSVHKLIAQTFLPNPDNHAEINHINGDKQDNRLDNLEWCSRKQNVQHSVLTGLKINKLTPNQAREIRKIYQSAPDKKSRVLVGRTISKKYGVTEVSVYNIGTERTWKCLTTQEGQVR